MFDPTNTHTHHTHTYLLTTNFPAVLAWAKSSDTKHNNIKYYSTY